MMVMGMAMGMGMGMSIGIIVMVMVMVMMMKMVIMLIMVIMITMVMMIIVMATVVIMITASIDCIYVEENLVSRREFNIIIGRFGGYFFYGLFFEGRTKYFCFHRKIFRHRGWRGCSRTTIAGSIVVIIIIIKSRHE